MPLWSCGNVKPSCVYMVGEGRDRKCSKKFPKHLASETVLSEGNNIAPKCAIRLKTLKKFANRGFEKKFGNNSAFS